MNLVPLKDNKGIALITALMLTLISMTMIMALMYMINESTQASGSNKRFRTALEASYGGTEIMMKDVLPLVLQNMSSSNLTASFTNVGLQLLSGQTCLQAKLTTPTAQWGTSCSSTSSTPSVKQTPDIGMTLQAASGNPYAVYSKIVDTVRGNTDTSGLELDTHSVAETSSVLMPQHLPYVYRLEIQGERSDNPVEKSDISVLYAY